jgi:hypothetical protein
MMGKEYVERWYRISRDRSLAIHRDGAATLYLDPGFTQLVRLTSDEMKQLQEALIEKPDIMPVSKMQP